MKEDTFGDTEQFKMLPFLTEKISELDNPNRKTYLSNFIIEFNKFINEFKTINNTTFRNKLLDLTHDTYINKTNYLIGKYEGKIITYLRNYIKAKIKTIKSLAEDEKITSYPIDELTDDEFKLWSRTYEMGGIEDVKIVIRGCAEGIHLNNQLDWD